VAFAFLSAQLSAGTAVRAQASPGVALSSQTVGYSRVFPGTDAKLTATPEGGIKEELVLSSRAAVPWNGEFTYALKLEGLDATPITDDQGSHILLSESGAGNSSPVLRIAPPSARDALGARTDACWYLLSEDRNTLTIVVDSNWLLAKDRAYPVVVDPTVTSQSDATDSMDTYTDSTTVTHPMSSTLMVDSTKKAWLRFPLNFLPRGTSVSASLVLTLNTATSSSTTVAIKRVDQPWDAYTLNTDATYGNAPTQSTTITTAGGTIDPSNSTTWSRNITSAINSYYLGSVRNFGIVIERASGGSLEFYSSEDSTPANRPKLVVTIPFTIPSAGQNHIMCGAPRAWEGGVALKPYQTVNQLMVMFLPLFLW
jgi:hypothetical protein